MSYTATASTGAKNHSISGSHDDEAARRCALGFNPSGHEPTEKIKAFHAAAMKAVIDERAKLIRPDDVPGNEAEIAGYNDAMRGFATALTHLETAQMFAVKALHARKNAGA